MHVTPFFRRLARRAFALPAGQRLTHRQALVLGSLLASGQVVHGQDTTRTTLNQWATLIQTYPRTHDPALLANTLAYARAATPGEQQTLLGNQGATLGFYHTWLAEHPAERVKFRQQLSHLPAQHAWHRLLLRLADSVAVPSSRGPSPTHNDFLWGAYFATGRPQYLDSVVAQCRYLATLPQAPRQQQPLLYYTSASALWSLAANARQDATVQTYLQAPAVRQQLANYLAQGRVADLSAAAEKVLADF